MNEPPPIPPVPAQDQQFVPMAPPPFMLKPLKGLLSWIVGLAATLIVLDAVILVPFLLHQTGAGRHSEIEAVQATAFIGTVGETLFENSAEMRIAQFKALKSGGSYHHDGSESDADYSCEEDDDDEPGYPEKAWSPLPASAQSTNPDPLEMLTQGVDMPESLMHSDVMPACSLVILITAIVNVILTLVGGILTIVLVGRMVHNARIVDAERPHASVEWTVISFFIPLVNMYIPVRELWRSWRGMAEARGLQASGLLLGLWWGTNLLVYVMTQVGSYVPGAFSLCSILAFTLVFHIFCVVMFSNIRKTAEQA